MTLLTPHIVRKYEELLDTYEKVSLVFLLYEDSAEGLLAVENIFCNNVIYEWCRKELPHWKDKLIESICLIQNFNLLHFLGFKKEDAIHLIKLNNRPSYVSLERRNLYLFFESLTPLETEKLIRLIGNIGITNNFNPELLKYSFIEVYFMIWESNGIEISLEVLKKKIRQIFCSEICKESELRVEVSNAPLRLKKEPDNIDCYEIIDPKKVGVLLIVNQEEYKHTLNPRRGSNVDCRVLEKTMKRKKFETHILKNLEGDDIYPSIVKKVKETFDKTVHSILMLVIMSHGDKDVIYGVDCVPVSTDSVRVVLNSCSCLKDKPVIIIFQSCRGTNVPVKSINTLEEDGHSERMSSITDYVIGWATLPGCKAFRDIEKGSWFILTLCEFIDKSENESFEAIFKKVIKAFKEKKEFKIPLKKSPFVLNMMPEISACLTKELFLSLPP